MQTTRLQGAAAPRPGSVGEVCLDVVEGMRKGVGVTSGPGASSSDEPELGEPRRAGTGTQGWQRWESPGRPSPRSQRRGRVALLSEGPCVPAVCSPDLRTQGSELAARPRSATQRPPREAARALASRAAAGQAPQPHSHHPGWIGSRRPRSPGSGCTAALDRTKCGGRPVSALGSMPEFPTSPRLTPRWVTRQTCPVGRL